MLNPNLKARPLSNFPSISSRGVLLEGLHLLCSEYAILAAPVEKPGEVSVDATKLRLQRAHFKLERFDVSEKPSLLRFQVSLLDDPTVPADSCIAPVLEHTPEVLDSAGLLVGEARHAHARVQLAHRHVRQFGLGQAQVTADEEGVDPRHEGQVMASSPEHPLSVTFCCSTGRRCSVPVTATSVSSTACHLGLTRFLFDLGAGIHIPRCKT